MLNLSKSIEELGPVTILAELGQLGCDLAPVRQDILRSLPVLPPAGSESDHILRLNLVSTLEGIPKLHQKPRLIVVGPELLLLEVLYKLGFDSQVLVVVSNDLDQSTLHRLSSNIPQGLSAEIIALPRVPSGIRPADSVMLAIGFDGGCGNVLVVDSTRAILNFYRGTYFGEVICLDPLGFPVLNRPQGWVTVNSLFTQYVSIAGQREAVNDEVN